jgi:hypothetical protein
MLGVLKASTPTARASAERTLDRGLATMDTERGTINGILRSAERALSDNAALPDLPA